MWIVEGEIQQLNLFVAFLLPSHPYLRYIYIYFYGQCSKLLCCNSCTLVTIDTQSHAWNPSLITPAVSSSSSSTKSSFLKYLDQLEKDKSAIYNGVQSLKQEVTVWSDYLSMTFHSRSIHQVYISGIHIFLSPSFIYLEIFFISC